MVRDWSKRILSWCNAQTKDHPQNFLPLIDEVQDADWNPSDLKELLGYLTGSVCGLASSGRTRICDICSTKLGMGADWRTDGEFAWPKDLAHYVEFHHVRLPDEFVERIRRLDYKPPLPEKDAFLDLLERAGVPTMR